MNRPALSVLGGFLLLAGGVALGRNIGQNAGQDTPQARDSSTASESCSRTVLFNFPVINRRGENVRDVPIWQVPGSEAFFFVAGMTIDADGVP